MSGSLKPSCLRNGVLLTAATLAAALSCTPEAFINNTASLGGTTPGQRGDIRLLFINNTPYRAMFTFGAYDLQDQEDEPQYLQFVVDGNATPDALNRGLAGNTSSVEITLECARTVSIGDPLMIARILEKDVDPLSATRNEAAMEEGVLFSNLPIDDPDANPTLDTAIAFAEPRVTLQGVEFQCDSLLTYTFELDDTQPGGVRVDLEVILP